MSVSTSGSTPSQSVNTYVLQQLLSGGGNLAGSGLSSGVLKALLNNSGSTAGSTTDAASGSSGATGSSLPTEVSQALGDLLSGNNPTQYQANLDKVQAYFQQNPSALTSLMSGLRGAGTYGANGSYDTSTESLLATLKDKSSDKATRQRAVAELQLQLSNNARSSLPSSLGGSTSSGSLSLLG
jgi:hypothetical protein